MIHNYAPVLVPTLNRFEHFRTCILSLVECKGSNQTDLFVLLDYPTKELHWEGYNKILEFLTNFNGFKSVNVIKRSTNFGAHDNIIDGYKIVFEKYDRLILSEDDNVFSKDFLIYMNKTLEKYKDDSTIFSVSGYNYPITIPNQYQENIYLWCGFSAWGVGLWKDKLEKVNFNEKIVRSNIKSFFKDLNKVIQFNNIANIYITSLIHMLKEKKIHSDIIISLYQFLHNMNSVFPVVSRVRNTGNDGSGVNCSFIENDIYSSQEIFNGSNEYEISNINLSDKNIAKTLQRHFYLNKKAQIKVFCKVIFINLGLYKI